MPGIFKIGILWFKGEHIERLISIMLRVPGLVLLDNWCNMSANDIWHYSFESSDLVNFIVSSFVLIQGLLLVLLPFHNLVILYKHYLSLVLMAASELLFHHYDTAEKKVDSLPLTFMDRALTCFPRQAVIISLHIVIVYTISSLVELDSNTKSACLAIYTLPVPARLVNCSSTNMSTLHNVSTGVTILAVVYYALVSLPAWLSYLRSGYRVLVNSVNLEGLTNTMIATWSRVFIVPQLFVFWALLIARQLYTQWHKQKVAGAETFAVASTERGKWYILVLYTVSEICVTHISLAASCVAVMYLSSAVLNLTKLVAQGGKGLVTNPWLSRTGSTEAITMTLLALQTGLVYLPMPQRLGAMSIILFIVVGSLVQSMHELVEPVLMSLSASNTYSLSRHVRILSVCSFLLVFPLYMASMVFSLLDADYWTLVVLSTCVLTSVQVLGALIVYALFLYDSYVMGSSWEDLDDFVYFAQSVTQVLEFLVALFLVVAGVRETVMQSQVERPWSWPNGIVLAIHFYYNVYLRLQSGWTSFLLRRDAAHKIHFLPAANQEQLRARSHDVCSICYAAMRSARVTPCQHLFHATCLKKWLYVQDRCPLCSARVNTPSRTGLQAGLLIRQATQASQTPWDPTDQHRHDRSTNRHRPNRGQTA